MTPSDSQNYTASKKDRIRMGARIQKAVSRLSNGSRRPSSRSYLIERAYLCRSYLFACNYWLKGGKESLFTPNTVLPRKGFLQCNWYRCYHPLPNKGGAEEIVLTNHIKQSLCKSLSSWLRAPCECSGRTIQYGTIQGNSISTSQKLRTESGCWIFLEWSIKSILREFVSPSVAIRFISDQ